MLKKSLALLGTTVITAAACGDPDTFYLTPIPKPLPNDCVNPEIRNMLGDQGTGTITLRVRALIASSADGTPAVSTAQPSWDMVTLNAYFAPANIRFVLVDRQILPPEAAPFQVTSTDNPLCHGDLAALSADAIPILYVDKVTTNGFDVGGLGNACGAVIDAHPVYSNVGDTLGTFSSPEGLPHEVGHVLGLSHTHECVESSDYPDNPNLNGDLIADTPFDPGPAGDPVLGCGDSLIAGQCTLVESGNCVVDCADGSTPDIHNFMSYYSGCRDHFSAGQAVFMRCDAESTHVGAQCDNVWARGYGENWLYSTGGSGSRHWHVADVNGDGKDDAVLHYLDNAPTTWTVALSNGKAFEPGAVWSEDHGVKARSAVADVDGDGKADAVAYEDGTWSVALSTGTSFATPSIWIAQFPGNWQPLVGDVDGDGKADAIAFDDAAGRWSVALSTGSSFLPPVPWIEGFGQGSTEQLIGDVDGDGKADAVTYTEGGEQWNPIYDWRVARSLGNGFAPPSLWYEVAMTAFAPRRMLADVDGDGKRDVVRYFYSHAGWYANRSTGTEFAKTELLRAGLGQGVWLPGFQDTADAQTGDIDGDGKADLVAFDMRNLVWTTSVCR